MNSISFRGIQMIILDNRRDSRNRILWTVTVDGETVGVGYSREQAISRAKSRMA